ncbi:hypothetical protein P170DRAFT_405284 [Aspergillus steynii IBT 23096]|uniref:F-box domain-containing protein n=1 Tax=Aspergillus steynii IBT 23096 TaxID=1392250 RepID=A0A2I2GBQ9_9EURO|nr:uncharacterized protein P170DRAFT_405284 [Aspergillus steynii IBT 23096]PLB50320.1 hypothetical protein P170DRAFT_405284 [Aspergillus steynii IBT 23096]
MDILRIASYHRRDYDLAVLRINPGDHDQVRSSLLSPSRDPSSLGHLETLSLEILHEICLYLDIQSLFQFRHTNRRSQQLVSATYPYKPVIHHALEALCIILRTGAASYFTLPDLFDVLCTRDCYFCGAFSGFLFLPSFKTCCFTCIREDALPCAISFPAYMRRPGVPSDFVPTMRALPGVYSLKEIPWKASEARVRLRTSDYVWPGKITRKRRSPTLSYVSSTVLPYFDPGSGAVQGGVSCSGCQVALEKKLSGERVESRDTELRDKVYSQGEFLAHFKDCQGARELWELSGQGISAADVSEFVRCRGYFGKRDVDIAFNPCD